MKRAERRFANWTISVTNNQMPLMPLFSPVYTSTRPYSQTRSSTQRDLMQPDEILRLEYDKCIALFQGHKPALLYKLTPEEIPGYNGLRPCRVIDYTPEWKRRELETPQAKEAPVAKQPEAETASSPIGPLACRMQSQRRRTRRDRYTPQPAITGSP